MATKDYYLILGVPRTETADGIRRAFRRLAKDSHPDRTGSERTAPFRDVVEAYGVLSDPERRRRHDEDLERSAAPRPRPAAAPGGTRPGWPEPEPLIPEPRSGPGPEPLGAPRSGAAAWSLRPAPIRLRSRTSADALLARLLRLWMR